MGIEICVIDTETTGVDEDARLVEIGAVVLSRDEDDNIEKYPKSDLVNPGIPIPPTASAIHHITDDMVADMPAARDVFQDYCYDYYVAHNAAFDLRFLEHLGGRWICTMKCAYEKWHDAPGYSNQVLRYWLDLPSPPERAGYPHRALYDSYVTAELFMRLMDEGMGISEMLKISARPRLLREIPFGKHAGTKFTDLPPDYIDWMRKQKDWDEDVQYTLNQL